MKTLVFTVGAARDYDALPAEARRAVDASLSDYAVSRRGDIKRLQASPYLRLRVGRYRVVFAEDRVTIPLIYVGKRETTTYNRP